VPTGIPVVFGKTWIAASAAMTNEFVISKEVKNLSQSAHYHRLRTLDITFPLHRLHAHKEAAYDDF
jgi:hypothetical protein